LILADEIEVVLKGPELSRELFGGVLDYDGAGHFPGLELLNFVFGVSDAEGSPAIFPNDDEALLTRHSHDFARRLVWDEEHFADDPRKDQVFYDDQSVEAIRKMLECLQLDIPNRSKKSVTWERAHFFPYTYSLIHWDARKPRSQAGNILIERRYLRGAGALAFKALRMDPDSERLERCRIGFNNLFSSNDTNPLERMARLLRGVASSDDRPKVDEIESKTIVKNDDQEELFRDGVCMILQHTKLASVARIQALMRWTGLWLVLVQHERAARKIGEDNPLFICDCGSSYAQLRRTSQRCFKEAQATIIAAVETLASEKGGRASKSSLTKIRGFFWATAATVGLLNSWRGRRHFTLDIGLLETLVMASTEPGEEMTYETFVSSRLFDDLGLVVGRVSADKAGLLNSIDASVFEDNENQLAMQMEAAGLLTAYSDATRMVGTGGLI
jgi:hypothetical protein